MNEKHLWNQRTEERLREIFRYGRYMFNDHLLIVLLFAIGGGAFYYKDWVTTLDEHFPTALLFAVIFSISLSCGNVITFLKEADKVFLLPVETQLKKYFVRSYFLTIVWRLCITFLIFLVLVPIYLQTVHNGLLPIFALLLVILQAGNLYIRWKMDFDQDQSSIVWDVIIRLLLNGSIVFFFIGERYWLSAITIIIFCFYGMYFHVRLSNRGLPWERLIANEEKRMAFFYRVANMFTDVPQLRNPVKRRKWADIFMNVHRWSPNHTYSFLFVRTFFRSGDYFGLFTRLTIIAILLIWGLDGSYIAFAVALLFIYLTGFQLISLWKHYDDVLWPDLYPIREEVKRTSFLKLIRNVLVVQTIIFTLTFLTSLQIQRVLLLFMILIAFSYAFVFVYCKKRIENWT